MACEQANKVIIRIWTSRDNRRYPGANVGHVSIQTTRPARYMSLWPIPFSHEQISNYQRAGTLERMYLKYFETRDSKYMDSYEDDYRAEGNSAPQILICLYSLNNLALTHAFDELKGRIQNWRLIGSNLFVQTIETVAGYAKPNTKLFESTLGKKDVDNCASLAYKLLKSAGIYDLLSHQYSTKFSSVVTPDDLSEAVLAAKSSELSQYPETKAFHFDAETPVAVPANTGCCIL